MLRTLHRLGRASRAGPDVASQSRLFATAADPSPAWAKIKTSVNADGKQVVEAEPGGPVLGPLRSHKVFLNKGEEVWWCACGLSKTPPLCDGSHETPPPEGPFAIEPVHWVAPEAKLFGLCLCRYTRTPPVCDGTHKGFPGYVPPKPRPGAAAAGTGAGQAGGAPAAGGSG